MSGFVPSGKMGEVRLKQPLFATIGHKTSEVDNFFSSSSFSSNCRREKKDEARILWWSKVIGEEELQRAEVARRERQRRERELIIAELRVGTESKGSAQRAPSPSHHIS